jgi:anti-sigma B factor antagonist
MPADAVARLTVSVRHASGCATVEIAGELDMATAPLVDEQTKQLQRQGAAKVCLDTSGVEFIDSSGLLALVALADEVDRMGAILRPTGASNAVRRVVEITGLHQLIPL